MVSNEVIRVVVGFGMGFGVVLCYVLLINDSFFCIFDVVDV